MESLESRPYADFISVRENYYPEINPNSIQSKNIRWNETFPHAAFVKFIKMATKMLGRENNDNHNIWIEGAYGTGKSRLMWALQCLLDASPDDARNYFQAYESLRKERGLLSKLLSLKDKKIITVSHYGSGDVNTTAKFIDVVFTDVSRRCKEKNCDPLYGKTIRGKVVDWLSVDVNRQYFENLLSRPKYQKDGTLAGKTVQQIIAELNKPVKQDSTKLDTTRELLEKVVRIGEENGVSAFKLDIDDLSSWIEDVIAENEIDGIIFFWDEFTSYIRQNSHSLDSLQKLVGLSARIPFYFVLATHLHIAFATEEQIKDKHSPFNALFDRFDSHVIDLPDSVAFDLIADSITTNKQTENDYRALLGSINMTMIKAREAVSKFAQVSEETLERIIPIHPYAALVLKYIAKEFASNQRSMFSFMMNGESEDLETFEWFIKNHSPEDGTLLTTDRLWNFFYEKGTDSRAEGALGRENLNSYIAQVLDAYPMSANQLESELTRRVFKCVLMLHAISRIVGNTIPILRPTLKNIMLAFEGDSELSQQISSQLNELDQKGLVIVNKDEDDPYNTEYYATITTNDTTELEKIKKQLRESTSTEFLINEGRIGAESFVFTEGIKARFKFVSVTPSNFTKKANELANSDDKYHIGALLCFARDEQDQIDLRQRFAEIPKHQTWNKLVFIDASAVEFGNRRFENYITQAAYERLMQSKGYTDQSADRKNRKNQVLTEWGEEILANPVRIVYNGSLTVNKGNTEISCQGDSINTYLQDIVRSLYPLSFDHCKVSNNFFDAKFNGGKQGAGANINLGIFQDASVNQLIDPNIRACKDYWKDPEYEKTPIVQLKIKVDQFVQENLNKYGRVSFLDIFDYLVPFGFMPVSLYSYLMGFLLKEYAQNDLYHFGIGDSGENGDVLTPDKLGEYVNEALKHRHLPIKNFIEKYLEIMTPDQKAYIDFVKAVFNVDAPSVELTANKMRTKLAELGPIWCFKRLDEAKMFTAHLDLIAQIASVPVGKNVLDLAGKLGKQLDGDVVSALKSVFTIAKVREGMRILLKSHQSGVLFELATKLGLDESEAVQDALDCVTSEKTAWSWLWEEETGLQQIDSLILEYKIMCESYEPTKTRVGSFKKCVDAWIEFTRQLKAPYESIQKENVEITDFIGDLYKIASEGKLAEARRVPFLKALEENKEKIVNLPASISEIIRTTYKAYVQQFDDADLARLIAMLPTSCFIDDDVTFSQNLTECTKKIRQEKKKHELREQWRNLTNSDSPRDWSRDHKTPALALAPRDEFDKVKRLFDTINNDAASENQILEAIAFLNSEPTFISNLNDDDEVEAAFRTKIIGDKYSHVLKDNDKVRRYLINAGYGEPYYWSEDSRIQEEIRKLAKMDYRQFGYAQVVSSIDSMTPEQAKEYLKELVKNDFEVGISIIARNSQSKG